MFDNFWRKFAGCCALYGSAAVVIMAIFLYSRSVGVDFFTLTKDPLAGQARTVPVYTSILSNLGIIGWCFTAAVQIFAAWSVRVRQPGSQAAGFLLWSGLITLLLMLDDFLMLHERMDRTAEAIVFGGYGVFVAAVLLRFRAIVLGSNYLVLAGALACFLLSMVLDNIVERLAIDIPYRTMLEDAFKIVGITGWVYYFIGLSVTIVRDVISRDRAGVA